MARLFYAIVLGLVGAGVVHIAIVLMVPQFSERDAWSALAEAGERYEPLRLDESVRGDAIVASVDPLFDAVACRFDLAEGVVRIDAVGEVPYWSAAIHDRAGLNTFSFNDRTSAAGTLDFVIASPTQMIRLRNDLPADFASSIFIEADLAQGIAVVRAFTPDESWEPAVSAYLDALSCTLHPL